VREQSGGAGRGRGGEPGGALGPDGGKKHSKRLKRTN